MLGDEVAPRFLHLLVCMSCIVVVCQANVNLALGKQTEQSTTHTIYKSGRAVDGNKNRYFWKNTCTHTSDNLTPAWWYVDLGNDYRVTSIRMVNRLHNEDRLHNFTIKVSRKNPKSLSGFPGSTSAPLCLEFGVRQIPDSEELYHCNIPIVGRYVSVEKYDQNRGNGPLTLCEFEVYSLDSQQAPTTAVPIERIPEVFSMLHCANLCASYTGQMCRNFQYHAISGMCQLLYKTVTSEMVNGPDWLVYNGNVEKDWPNYKSAYFSIYTA